MERLNLVVTKVSADREAPDVVPLSQCLSISVLAPTFFGRGFDDGCDGGNWHMRRELRVYSLAHDLEARGQ